MGDFLKNKKETGGSDEGNNVESESSRNNNSSSADNSNGTGTDESLSTIQDKEDKQRSGEASEGVQEDTRPFEETVERFFAQPRDEKILTLTRLYLRIEKLEHENKRLSVTIKRLNRKLKKSNTIGR